MVQAAPEIRASQTAPPERRPRSWWYVLMVILVLSPLTARAQELRIGYVDQKRLLDTAPQVVNAREELDQEFRPRNEALIADEARLNRLQQELEEDEILDPEERMNREREIRNLRRSIQRRREDLAEELRFRINSEKNSLEETIAIAVREVAREGDYDLVLTSPVAYASESIDITDEVMDWLEADFRETGNGQSP